MEEDFTLISEVHPFCNFKSYLCMIFKYVLHYKKKKATSRHFFFLKKKKEM